MKALGIITLALLANSLLSSCASSYAKKCIEWSPYKSWYDLAWGAVERHDVYRCVYFSEVP